MPTMTFSSSSLATTVNFPPPPISSHLCVSFHSGGSVAESSRGCESVAERSGNAQQGTGAGAPEGASAHQGRGRCLAAAAVVVVVVIRDRVGVCGGEGLQEW